MGNVAEFKHKTYPLFVIKITYTDGVEEVVETTLFGEMEVFPGFIGFSKTAPDTVEEVPSLIVKADLIRNIRLIGTKERILK
jgi:hypothetical protein